MPFNPWSAAIECGYLEQRIALAMAAVRRHKAAGSSLDTIEIFKRNIEDDQLMLLRLKDAIGIK